MSQDPWTAYWRTGASGSCFEDPKSELHLTQIWNDLVDNLPDNSRMLDLATGNGTVPRICVMRARARRISLEVDAIDAAEIDPVTCLPESAQFENQIRFHNKTRMEALPFRSGSFDSVVSQFGFEYSCEMRAAAEAARVLKRDGRLRLIMHTKGGGVARDIALRLERMHSVLAENGPVSLALELARAHEVGDVRTIRRKEQHLPAAVNYIKKLLNHPLPDDSALFYSNELLRLWYERRRYNPTDLRFSMESGWTNINDMAIRLEQMVLAARGSKGIDRLCERLKVYGLKVMEVEKVCDKNNVKIAWRLDARKSALS